MKKLIIYFFISFNFLFSQELNYEGKLGYFLKLQSNIKYNNTKKTVNILTNDIVNNINPNVEVLAYSKYKDIKKSYLDNSLDMIIIRVEDYLKDSKLFDKYTSEYLVFPKMNNKNLDKLYLISNKKNLDENSSILLHNNDNLSFLFLEKIYLENNKKLENKNISYLEVYNTIFLKVYFKEYDYSIVPKYVYDLMVKLNPSISKKIFILKKSEDIYNTNILLLRKNSKNSILKRKINQFIINIKKNILYEAFQVGNLKYLKTHEIENLKKFYLEYKELKR